MKKPRDPQWKLDAPVIENARRELPLMIERFLAEGDRAIRPGTPVEKLHEFRLSAKRLRYTLEAFRRLYGPTLVKYIQAVRAVQNVLGELNDCRTTHELLSRVPAQPEMPALLAFLEARQQQKREAFVELWTSRFAPRTFRQSILQYPRNYAKRKSS